MVKAEIEAGVCGLKTEVKAESAGQGVQLDINSDCPHIQKIAAELKEVEGMNEIFTKMDQTKVYQLAKQYCPHVACAVPAGILKAVEVASGLALPKDVAIKIIKE
ncbi:hypothetical protein RDV78_09635 [Bacillota bacterium LX-D]|nr:hypothetical protein [Bacillota bacterium LX-D]